jgi:hypothetical protein
MAIRRKDITPAVVAHAEISGCIVAEIFGEGVFNNCRWAYYPDSLSLSIASKSNFDRWSNSRVIDIYPVILDNGDPSLLKLLEGIEMIFKHA